MRISIFYHEKKRAQSTGQIYQGPDGHQPCHHVRSVSGGYPEAHFDGHEKLALQKIENRFATPVCLCTHKTPDHVDRTIVVFIFLYMFNLVAALLEDYPILGYLSLMHYYDASNIFKQQAVHWPDMAILLGVFSVMSGASIVTFRRKEIYI